MRHCALWWFHPKLDLKPSSSVQIRVRTKAGTEPTAPWSPRPRLESSLLSYEFKLLERISQSWHILLSMHDYTHTHAYCQLSQYFLETPALHVKHTQNSVHAFLFMHCSVSFWHCKTEHVEIMCNSPLTYQAVGEGGGGDWTVGQWTHFIMGRFSLIQTRAEETVRSRPHLWHQIH